MGHCFQLQEPVSPFQDFSVGEVQSPDKPDLEEEKAAMKPDVPQSSQNALCLVWAFFLFHSCFQTTPHRYTLIALIPNWRRV